MSLDSIALLKLASMIATAGFTIMGILTKDKTEGRVTWGRVAGTGAVVSLLLSVVLFGFEQRALADANRKSAEAQKAANDRFDSILNRVEANITGTNEVLLRSKGIAEGVEKSVAGQERVVTQTGTIAYGLDKSISEQRKILRGTLQTVEGISRVSQEQGQLLEKQQVVLQNTVKALTPLNPVAFVFGFSYPLDDRRILPYVQRVQKIAESGNAGRFTYNRDLKMYVTRGLMNQISSIELGHGSRLFPDENTRTDVEAAKLLNIVMLRLAFYRNAPALEPSSSKDWFVELLGTSGSDTGEPAIDKALSSPLNNKISEMKLLIDFDNNRVIQTVFSANMQVLDSRHTIGSLLDLENTVLEIIPAGTEPRLENFEIRTGYNYQQSYFFDPTLFQKKYINNVPRLYYRFKKDDFKISL